MSSSDGWTVVLTGDHANVRKAIETYGHDYFPRGFHYKSEAQELCDKLAEKGIRHSLVRGLPRQEAA